MKTTRWIVFGLMVVAQLAVPVKMIANSEQTLQGGTAFKFRCGPVDPYDYFRGRYVALSFPDAVIPDWKGKSFDPDEPVFALLGTGEGGFAIILDVTETRPDTPNYLEVRSNFIWATAPRQLRLKLPFDRYYMNETMAPAAEEAYRTQTRTTDDVYVLVRVLEGQGVIDGLYVDGTPIELYLQREVMKKPTGGS